MIYFKYIQQIITKFKSTNILSIIIIIIGHLTYENTY